MQSQHVVPVYKNIQAFVYLEFKNEKKGFSGYQKEVVIECS